MPKKEIITDREIATDIARNANNANLSMTIDEYRKTRTVKFRLTEIAVVIAIVAVLLLTTYLFPLQFVVGLWAAIFIGLIWAYVLVFRKHRDKPVSMDNYAVTTERLLNTDEDHHTEIPKYRNKFCLYRTQVDIYTLHFENGKEFRLPRDNYTWSREIPMSDATICRLAHRGDTFIVATEKSTGKIAAVYHTDFFTYKKA